MIYITGDTHGEVGRFTEFQSAGEPAWNPNDILLICGDFGYLYTNDEKERRFLDTLAEKPYTIAFCDGNHENFPAIFSYPTEDWMGGQVHRIRQNILHLMRGQIYTIEGKTFFVLGGAYSIDRAFRTTGISYWEEELPSNDDYRTANASLNAHSFRVDYILTHTAPQRVIYRMGKIPDRHDAELTGYLDWLAGTVVFRQWFFGHFHTDEIIDGRYRALWWDVIPLGESGDETLPQKS